jgi:hypothetical protein
MANTNFEWAAVVEEAEAGGAALLLRLPRRSQEMPTPALS